MIACFARIKENTGATFLKPESCVWDCAPQKLSKDARWSRQRVENFSPGPNQTLPWEHSNMQITLICIQTELSRLKGVNVNNSLVFYITCAKLTKMAQFGKLCILTQTFYPKPSIFQRTQMQTCEIHDNINIISWYFHLSPCLDPWYFATLSYALINSGQQISPPLIPLH